MNDILKSNLIDLIKDYGFDATYNICIRIPESNHDVISTLLSLTTQYMHHCRWTYDVETREIIDTWKPILNSLWSDKKCL